MAVDRGELRYNIRVTDNFTEPIRRFRREILLAQSTIDQVRNSTIGFRQLTASIRQTQQATRGLRAQAAQNNAADRQERAEQLRRLRELAAAQKQQASNEKIRASLNSEIRAAQQQQARAAASSARTQAASAAQAAQAAAAARKQQQQLVQSLLNTNAAANRVAFTFRRLFGILAAFTVARQAVGAFTGLIGSSIQFNRTVEDTQIGLAALFTTLGQVSDAQGNLLQGGQAYAEATRIAASQMDKLRIDALRTTATFEQLVSTFQIAIAPGLAAGLQLDEIRELSVLVSQAAGAVGVSQDQLAEEIRALTIPGAATSRTSRIFTALTISPAELKRAKDGGQLFDFLVGKLRTFNLASEASQKTFTGLLARLQDAIGIASGTGGFVFFEELKSLLRDVGDLLLVVERDAKGAIKNITPDPRAVETLSILFLGLRDAVATLRSGLKEFDLSAIQNAVAALAQGFRIAAQIAVGFVRGLTQGLGDVFRLGQQFFGLFGSNAVQETVQLITRLALILGTASLLLKTILGTAKLLILPFTIAAGAVSSIVSFLAGAVKLAGLVPVRMRQWLGVLGLIFVGFKKVFEFVTGLSLTFGDTGEILSLTFQEAWIRIVDGGELAFKGFANFLVSVFAAPVEIIAGLFLDLTSSIFGIASGLASFIPGMTDAREGIEDIITSLNRLKDSAKIPKIFDPKQLKEQNDDLNRFISDSQKKFDELVAKIQARNSNKDATLQIDVDTPNDDSFDVAAFVQNLNAQLTGLIGENVVDLPGLKEALEKARKLIDETVGTVTPQIQLTEFETGIQAAIDKTLNLVDIVKKAVESFASTAADAIVDAFDPNEQVDLRERFARFLQDLSRMILAEVIKWALFKTILGLAARGSSVPASELPFGFAEGGAIPGGRGVPANARPASLDSRDTTPIWAQPGEFMQQLSAVKKYGLGVMEAINDGLIDPTALRALAGLGSHRTIRRNARGPQGLATGGSVLPQGTAQGLASVRAQAPSAGPTIAIVAGNEQSMDRLLAGGQRAMLEFIRDNGPAIEGMLASNRRQ